MTTNLYGYSLDGETFHGHYATRDEAIAAGIQDNAEERYLSPGSEFTTGRHDAPAVASEFVPDVDDILEHMAQKADDEYGECDMWPDIGKDDIVEARQQLEAALQNFANAVQAVSPPSFHFVVDTEPHVIPEA